MKRAKLQSEKYQEELVAREEESSKRVDLQKQLDKTSEELSKSKAREAGASTPNTHGSSDAARSSRVRTRSMSRVSPQDARDTSPPAESHEVQQLVLM